MAVSTQDTPVKLLVRHRKDYRVEPQHYGSLSKAIDAAAHLHRVKSDWRPQCIFDKDRKKCLLPQTQLLKAIDKINQPKKTPPKEQNFRLLVRRPDKSHFETWHAEIEHAIKAASRMRITVGEPIAVYNQGGALLANHTTLKDWIADYDATEHLAAHSPQAFEQMEQLEGYATW